MIAAFYLTNKQGGAQFTAADHETIEMLAAHAAVAIENARLYARNREASVIAERNRLARELHDAISQSLFSIALTAEAVAASIDDDPAGARAKARDLRDLSRSAHEEMRGLIFALRPAALEADGLLPTIVKHLDVLRRTGAHEVVFRAPDYVRQPLALEQELFRILQEALNNVTQHAHASRIEVQLGLTAAGVRLVVADDGRGFDPDDPRIAARHLGLTSMRERVAALGGSIGIQAAPGAGTRIEVEVPSAGEH